MSYKPAIVANAVLHSAISRGIPVNHLKLHKLVFFVHAWSLVLYGRSVVSEQPEAWSFGPTFENLFYRLNMQGHREVVDYITTLEPRSGELQGVIPHPDDGKTWTVVNQVMDRYGGFSGELLSTLGHEPGGPWEQARLQQLVLIPDDLIRDFYGEKMARYKASTSATPVAARAPARINVSA